ncbi:hypothetical protein H2203_005814 [Taxawa tesnikishii (nom. ined.)]|nr:hypothetical protein H2203_005814 [Dothideales sp. JES 119]
MSQNFLRHQILASLGIEQLPTLIAQDEPMDDSLEAPLSIPSMITLPIPGKKCPACAAKGQTVWVIPGKQCPQCRTEVN